MAVAISRTADPVGVSASSNIATYSGASIGVAVENRIVVLVVTSELASASPNGATIDYGTGAIAMTAITGTGNFGAVYARIFYASAPTGTTADFAVTFGANPTSTQNHVSVYRVVGAKLAPASSGVNGSTDMDATAPLTTGAVTIATNGGFIAVAAGGTDTVAKTWANATADLDIDAGAFRHTTATRTTAGTVTITCTGATDGEDGALAYIIFTPGTFVQANAGSYALTGTAASVRRAYILSAVPNTLEGLDAIATLDALPFSLDNYDGGFYTYTGTAANVAKGRTILANAGSYALTGTAATLRHAWKLPAAAGSYTLNGSAAGTLHGWKVAAGAGSYALTGSTANVKHAWAVTATSGSYTLTGTAASLKHAWIMPAAAGSYSLTGTAAGLKHGWVVTATAGGYTLTGTAAGLKHGRVVTAAAGSFALTGTAAGVKHGWLVAAGAGSYALTGTAATLRHGWVTTAAAGTYELVGTAAGLTRTLVGKTLAADAGAYALTGVDATLAKTTAPDAIPSVNPDRMGGAGWQKKKKPKKEEIVQEVVEEVVEAIPAPVKDESRLIALRMAEQMTVRQLTQIQTIEALISRVEAEIAEMDDEEVLLLAA